MNDKTFAGVFVHVLWEYPGGVGSLRFVRIGYHFQTGNLDMPDGVIFSLTPPFTD